MDNETKFKAGDMVKHKLGFDCIVREVKTELVDPNSNMAIEIDHPYYAVVMQLDNGQLVIAVVPEFELE